MAGFMNRIAAARRLGAIIVIGMAVYCLPTALLTIVHSPWIAFLLEVIRGAGTIVVDVLAITALQRLVSPDVVARVFGVFFALVLASHLAGRPAHAHPPRQRRAEHDLVDHGICHSCAECCRVSMDPGPRHQGTTRTVRDRTTHRSAASARHLRRRNTGGLGAPGEISRRGDRLRPGTVLIREGAEADDFFVLIAGEVEVTAAGEAGAEHTLGVLGPPTTSARSVCSGTVHGRQR